MTTAPPRGKSKSRFAALAQEHDGWYDPNP